MSHHRLKKAGLSAALAVAVLFVAAALRQAPTPSPTDLAMADVAPVSDVAAVPSNAERTIPAAEALSAELDARRAEDARSAEDATVADAGHEADDGRTAIVSEPDTQSRIVVSIDKRWLWYIVGPDTVMSAPVAVGMNSGFSFAGRSFHFKTPRGQRKVLAKQEKPLWTVPEWHYYERARHQDLEVVKLARDSRVDLSDGTVIVVRGDDVGRINHYGNFWPFTPGNEIIFDGRIFVPPLGTNQRSVPEALGPYKLDMGDGYLIHGTHMYNEESVGRAVSHGCVRMNNDDLERLYWMVEEGTKVVIR